MALSQSAVLVRVRELLEDVEGIAVAYVTALSDTNGIPGGLPATPAALVMPGGTREYVSTQGQHRLTYEVRVELYAQAGESAVAAASLVDLPVRVIGVLLDNVALGGLCNSCLFERETGPVTLEYAGKAYVGHVITLRVSEQAGALPLYGESA